MSNSWNKLKANTCICFKQAPCVRHIFGNSIALHISADSAVSPLLMMTLGDADRAPTVKTSLGNNILFSFSVVPLSRDRSSSMMGVPSVVFLGKEDTFSNATTCYCETDTSCPATGVRDLSTCRNAPIMMSWPHFFLADPSYRQSIVGMNPDPEKHQFFMELADVSIILWWG